MCKIKFRKLIYEIKKTDSFLNRFKPAEKEGFISPLLYPYFTSTLVVFQYECTELGTL